MGYIKKIYIKLNFGRYGGEVGEYYGCKSAFQLPLDYTSN